ncbi:hypothetical protein HDC90_001097 [Pedobacter sp. AK013]|uniref:hypothetical protein n=1 Tax=Pedobacter sp. AK013 TaxID=2723071 RepID=UPI00161266FC|nr:hypothetical protein [Pedobacter sp. AK013]MBB6236485.1 hypothetical protein [Pedobacter sp. AK013]
MRTIRQIPNIPKDGDFAKFPDSTIKNETSTEDGTPVVREIYGDLLTNVYRILRLAKIDPSGFEDNADSGYQLVEALKKFSNNLNDVEQVLNLSGQVFSIGMDLSILPDKYPVFARAAENYNSSLVYTFKGSGAESYSFTAVNQFKSGDELLLIIDSANVRAYNLSQSLESSTEIFTPFGTPLAFNNGKKVWYQSEGVVFSDKPEVLDLQGSIRSSQSDGTILVYEIMLINGYFICLAFYPNTLAHKIFRIPESNITAPQQMVFVTGGFGSSDNSPYIYTDGTSIYITNASSNSGDEYSIDIYSINANNLSFSGNVLLSNTFKKTTNAVILNSKIYTLINGILRFFNVVTGEDVFVANFPANLGVLFALDGSALFSSGDVAKKWDL